MGRKMKSLERRHRIYNRIREMREDSDLRQKHLGEVLKCSPRTYSNYECGDLDIPTAYLIELGDFYGTSIDYLLGRTDVKTPYPEAKKKIDIEEV